LDIDYLCIIRLIAIYIVLCSIINLIYIRLIREIVYKKLKSFMEIIMSQQTQKQESFNALIMILSNFANIHIRPICCKCCDIDPMTWYICKELKRNLGVWVSSFFGSIQVIILPAIVTWFLFYYIYQLYSDIFFNSIPFFFLQGFLPDWRISILFFFIFCILKNGMNELYKKYMVREDKAKG
jgi:hypothetical protein